MLQECDICNATVDAKELARYECDETDEYGGFIVSHTRYLFLQCPRCKRPFVVSQYNDGVIGEEVQETLLPLPYRRVDPNLPPTVLSAFEEALSCLRSGANSATVLMSRKTLEAMCHENKISGDNLAQMLKTAKDRKVIDGRLFQWADELRLAGNRAAHDVVDSLTRQDAMDVVAFTHAMLEYIFTFQDKFDAFMARKKRGTITAPADRRMKKPPPHERRSKALEQMCACRFEQGRIEFYADNLDASRA